MAKALETLPSSRLAASWADASSVGGVLTASAVIAAAVAPAVLESGDLLG